MNHRQPEIPTLHAHDERFGELRVTGARARPHPDDDITYQENATRFRDQRRALEHEEHSAQARSRKRDDLEPARQIVTPLLLFFAFFAGFSAGVILDHLLGRLL